MNYLDDLAAQVEAEIPASLRPGDDGPTLYRLYALLALVKGEDVTCENVHDAWAVWMCGRLSRHRSLVPFDELSTEVQNSDLPFVDAIRRVTRHWLDTDHLRKANHDETA